MIAIDIEHQFLISVTVLLIDMLTVFVYYVLGLTMIRQ